MEEIGRAVAPVPFFTSAVLATTALLKAGETEVLGQLAAGGDSTAALVVPLSTAPGTFTPTVKQRRVDSSAASRRLPASPSPMFLLFRLRVKAVWSCIPFGSPTLPSRRFCPWT